MVDSFDNNMIMFLKLVENNHNDSLSLLYAELIEWNQEEPINLVTFPNDYVIAYYLNFFKLFNSSISKSSMTMTVEDIKFLSLKKKHKNNKRFDGENHLVAVSDPKIVKIKDMSEGENLSKEPEDGKIDILHDHFQERSSMLIDPTQLINLGT